jgi:uncharacterized membrane protein YfcA
MELIRFIRWWWRGLSEPQRVLVIMPFIVLSCVPGVWLFGMVYILNLLGAIFFALVSYLLYIIGSDLWRGIVKQWDKFKVERDREAEEIVRRLKG